MSNGDKEKTESSLGIQEKGFEPFDPVPVSQLTLSLINPLLLNELVFHVMAQNMEEL